MFQTKLDKLENNMYIIVKNSYEKRNQKNNR